MKKKSPILHSINVTFTCGKGHITTTGSSTFTVNGGGCYGHSEDEYCYCPMPEAVMQVICSVPECNSREEFTF